MIDNDLFDGLAMNIFAQGEAVVTTHLRLQVNMTRATEMVADHDAAAGDEKIVLRPVTTGVSSVQGELLRGVRLMRGEALVMETSKTTLPTGEQVTAAGKLLVDVTEGEVLAMLPRRVEIHCYEQRHEVDDKANARIDFRNLHLARDEAGRQRVIFVAEAVRGDLRAVREDDLFEYADGDFVVAGVVRSLKRNGLRFAVLQVEVEDGEVEDGATP